MVSLSSIDTPDSQDMETNQKPSVSKNRLFRRLRRLLFRSRKLQNKVPKLNDFGFKSIHRQYHNATLKQYSISPDQHSSFSENFSEKSIEISSPALVCKWKVEQNRPNLDTLPECILLHLFSYLNAQDVSSLGWCAPNLYTAALSVKKLWRNIHHVCDGSSPHHKLLQPFLNDYTTVLCLSNSTDSSSDQVQCENVCFEHNFFKNLENLSNLKSFTLENHLLDNKNRLNLRCLPECLTELRLRRINFLGQNGAPCLAFHNVHLNLPNLQVVDVSHCSWVTSKILYSLSNCSQLKTLVLAGCTQIDYVDLSLQAATIYGFWKLESLDLRLTKVTFEDVSIFKKLTRLKEIMLEKPEDITVKTTKPESKSKKKRGHPWRGSGCSWTKSAEDMSSSDSINMPTITLSEYVSSRLETLVVRNYSEITDFVLDEIRMYFGSMKYLDLTGTDCTIEKILDFQNQRPQLRLLY